jgi:hypothetical protein
MRAKAPVPPAGWEMQVLEVVPRLFIGNEDRPARRIRNARCRCDRRPRVVGLRVGPPGSERVHLPELPARRRGGCRPEDRGGGGVRWVAGQREPARSRPLHRGLNRAGVVVARTLVELGHSPADAIELVRKQRSLSMDAFEALSNESFVAWLLGEPRAPGRQAHEKTGW